MKIFNKKSVPPESFLYTGDCDLDSTITHLQYNQKEVLKHSKKVSINDDFVDWIIVEGLNSTDVVTKICKEFNVDNLVIEDILNVHQRNKIEVYDSYIFAVQRYRYIENSIIETDYISILLFEDKLITFSEKHNLFISNILSRLELKDSLLRKYRHDYLFYVIYDLITDEVLNVYKSIANQISDLEEDVFQLDRSSELVLYNLRKELIYMRNYSIQLRENLFENNTFIEGILGKQTAKYYKDLEDHIVNLNEKVKTEFELLKGLYDIYLNNNAHKMNKIMTTLTIFSAIFIPLSFLTGIFGMNFTNFPILSNQNGLLIFFGFSLLIPIIMLTYFKKNKWF